jgi:tetratricopeptide (TPR) repeat protein
VLPATQQDKRAFSYYRYGMTAQANGNYSEALENYYEALKFEEDLVERGYILYNIGLIYSNNGNYSKALEYYHQALELNSRLSQAFNNMGVIYHYQGTKAYRKKEFDTAQESFNKAGQCWQKALRLLPNNYIEAQNWLQINGQLLNVLEIRGWLNR